MIMGWHSCPSSAFLAFVQRIASGEVGSRALLCVPRGNTLAYHVLARRLGWRQPLTACSSEIVLSALLIVFAESIMQGEVPSPGYVAAEVASQGCCN